MEKVNNILTGFISNILGTGFMFLVTIFLTRMVDIEVYGEFRLAFSFVSLMVIILTLGRDSGIIFYLQDSKDEFEQNDILSQESFFTFISFFFGLIFLLLFKIPIIYFFFDNKINHSNYAISLLMLPLWGLFNIGIAGLKAKNFINYSFILTTLTQRLIRVPFFICFVLLSKSFLSLTLSMILSQLVLLFLVIRRLPSIINYKLSNFKFFTLRLRYSIQLGISSVIYVILTQLDLLMLGKLDSLDTVAQYDVSVLLSFVVLFPYISLVKSSEHVIKDILQNEKKLEKYNFNQGFAITLASIVLLIFLMESDLILSIFGNEYSKASVSLVILSSCYLFSGILSSPIEFLNMTGNVKFSLYILSFSVVINFIVNLYLIPVYSLNGAAVGTFISIIITKILANIIVKKKLNLNLVTLSNFTKLLPLIISFTFYLFLIKIIHFPTLFTKIIFDIFILSLCVFIIFLKDKKMLKNLYNKFDE